MLFALNWEGLRFSYFFRFSSVFHQMIFTALITLHLGFQFFCKWGFTFYCVMRYWIVNRAPFLSLGLFSSLMGYILFLDKLSIISNPFPLSLVIWNPLATVLGYFQVTILVIFHLILVRKRCIFVIDS